VIKVCISFALQISIESSSIYLPAKCLDAASNVDGAAVTIGNCFNTASQQWTFSGGSIKIFGNKCLDVIDGVEENGTNLQIWTCYDENTNQQFNAWVCRPCSYFLDHF